jgi:DNA adenine methylase
MSLSKSPLRYPGGKQKLAPFLVELLEANNLIGGHYVEPYAGGGGAALQLLMTDKVGSIHLNDSSVAIFAFWNAVLNSTDELCSLISSASLTVDEWNRQKQILKNPQNFTQLELGFSTFYLNRCNRSGVLTAGMIGGTKQEGVWKMDARFTRSDLIRRIESIAQYRNVISLSNLDTEEYLATEEAALPDNTLIYYDPPYYEKASGLYLDFYRKDDHKRLSSVIQSLNNHKWVLSYDGASQIIELYDKRRYFTYDLQYTASTIYKGKEVFVFCDDLLLPPSSSLPSIDEALKRQSSCLFVA